MSLTIKSLADAEIDEACTLFAQVFAVQVTPAAWRWKYAAENLLGSINIVAYDTEGALIGHAGAVVLAGVDAGQPRAMVQICDVMVAANRRGGTGTDAVYPALMRAMRVAIKARFLGAYAYGFPGKRPFLLGERLGYYRRSYDITEADVPLQGVPKTGLGWPLWRLHAVEWDTLPQKANRLNRLWLNEAESAGSPAVVRDAAYLRWRFAQHPTRRYTLLMLRRSWQDVALWVVAAEGDNVRVVDALGHEARSAGALELLGKWATQQGFTRLLLWHPEPGMAEVVTDTGIVAMQFALALDEVEPLRAPRFMPGDLDVF